MNRLSKIKLAALSFLPVLFYINILASMSDGKIDSEGLNAREVESEFSSDTGIDNFDDQDSGNWYEKRILLKKAGPKRVKISKKVAALNEGLKTFIEKRNQEESMVKRELLDFGFSTTHLDDNIIKLSKDIEEVRQKDGLNEQEKNLLEEIVKKKSDLDQLKSDFNLILQLDDSIGKANIKLMQQIEVASGYEQKALDLYDAIADVLDDKKAKSYYLQIETLLDNVEAIERYVNTQFSAYIDTTINTIKELIEKVKISTKSLQEQGIVLTSQFEEAQKAEQERLAKEKAAKKPVVTKSWIGSITDFIMQFFNMLTYPFVWIYKLIFGIK